MNSKFSIENNGKKIFFFAWVDKIRQLGSNLLFILCNISSEKKQQQIIVKKEKKIKELRKIKRGDLLKIWGEIKIKKDTEKEIEIELIKYKLFNSSKKLPFGSKENIDEDTRYCYRYLDLRRFKSKEMLLIKNQFCYELRNFLHKRKFIEVETPILAQNSVEGSNSFLVLSNFSKRYYTLPQSPQIFKQLLMIGGFNKYYQIAKSFRNEGARSNRQIEFSQLDLEISFTTIKQIKLIVEKLLKTIFKKIFNLELKIPFPILTYHEVIKKYGTDKPNLYQSTISGKELNFLWIVKWPLFKYNIEKKKYESFRHLFTIPQKKYIKLLLENKIEPEKVIGETFDLIFNGEEILSGGLRIYQRNLQEKIMEIIGYNNREREKNFGYFLEALEFAAPPHGGIGLGIDRFLSKVLNTKNLKELIAFPKNIDGTCSLTKTPNFVYFK